MKTLLKSVAATFFATAPLAVKEVVGQNWSVYWAVIYGLVVFATSLVVFQPDKRFLAVRDPTVKNYLKTALASAPPDMVRANIYVFRWLPWPGLVPIISYNANPAHADYGKKWAWGRGLCGRVYRTGRFGICRKGVDDPRAFGMKPADIAATEHVEAVFCVPLKRPAKSGSEAGVSSKVCAVLAYDALSPQAAEFLQIQHDSLVENRNRELLDHVEAISLVFLGGAK